MECYSELGQSKEVVLGCAKLLALANKMPLTHLTADNASLQVLVDIVLKKTTILCCEYSFFFPNQTHFSVKYC